MLATTASPLFSLQTAAVLNNLLSTFSRAYWRVLQLQAAYRRSAHVKAIAPFAVLYQQSVQQRSRSLSNTDRVLKLLIQFIFCYTSYKVFKCSSLSIKPLIFHTFTIPCLFLSSSFVMQNEHLALLLSLHIEQP